MIQMFFENRRFLRIQRIDHIRIILVVRVLRTYVLGFSLSKFPNQSSEDHGWNGLSALKFLSLSDFDKI